MDHDVYSLNRVSTFNTAALNSASVSKSSLHIPVHVVPTPQKTKIIFGGFRPGGLTSEIVFICTSAFFNSSSLPSATNVREYTSWSIYDKLKQGADLSNPLVGHLAIFTCQVGLTELWKYYGITPNVVIGQSVGEVAAAYASGALTLENAVKVIYHRSEILSRATGGSMFVVGNSDTEMVGKMCEEYDQKVNIAVYNSSVSCTVSGDIDQLILPRHVLILC
jgi:malonyl CoA-acyl carrier protein transacylase